MGVVPFIGDVVWLTQAFAFHKCLESWFIDSLVNASSAFHTSEVACGGFKLVLFLAWLLLLLVLQVLYDLGSGLLLRQSVV